MSAPGPTLWSTALRACLAGFGALGLNVHRIRRDAGLDEASLADPDARIPFPVTARIWPAAQAQWQKRGLGLHTGCALPFGELGVIDYAVASAPTLGEGVAVMARAFAIVSRGATRIDFERKPSGDGVIRFSGVYPPDVRDYGIASYVARLRKFGATPVELSLVGHPFDDERTYERLLGATPRFAAEENTITLCAQDLERPRDDERYRGLAPIVGREVERILSDASRSTTSEIARGIIARLLPTGSADGDALARAMSVSVRTLQRRLADEGTSLRALTESTREELARAHLAEGRLRVAEVAYLLGYSESGTFTTAFKRWTGVSPSEYRANVALNVRDRARRR